MSAIIERIRRTDASDGNLIKQSDQSKTRNSSWRQPDLLLK